MKIRYVLTILMLSSAAFGQGEPSGDEAALLRMSIERHFGGGGSGIPFAREKMIIFPATLRQRLLPRAVERRFGTAAAREAETLMNSDRPMVAVAAVEDVPHLSPGTGPVQYDWTDLKTRYPGRTAVLELTRPILLSGDLAVVQLHAVEASETTRYVHYFEKRDGAWKTVGVTAGSAN